MKQSIALAIVAILFAVGVASAEPPPAAPGGALLRDLDAASGSSSGWSTTRQVLNQQSSGAAAALAQARAQLGGLPPAKTGDGERTAAIDLDAASGSTSGFYTAAVPRAEGRSVSPISEKVRNRARAQLGSGPAPASRIWRNPDLEAASGSTSNFEQ